MMFGIWGLMTFPAAGAHFPQSAARLQLMGLPSQWDVAPAARARFVTYLMATNMVQRVPDGSAQAHMPMEAADGNSPVPLAVSARTLRGPAFQ